MGAFLGRWLVRLALAGLMLLVALPAFAVAIYFLVMASSLSAPSARYEVVRYDAAQLQFDIPETWKSTETQGFFVAQHPDKILTLLCATASQGDARTIGNNLPTVLGTWPNIKDVRVARSSGAEEINGMTQHWHAGRADYRRQDRPEFGNVRFMASVIEGPNAAAVVGVFGAVGGNEDVVQTIFRSIKRPDDSALGATERQVARLFRSFSPLLKIPYLLGATALVAFLLVYLGKVPVSYNIRNLAVRWKTTLLTALAFTLVVSLLTVMLGFVNGMYRLTAQSGKPENVIVLSDGATDENFSNLGFTDSADVALQPGVLRDRSNKPMCSREVYIVVNHIVPTPAGAKPRRRFVQVRGLEDPEVAGQVHGMDFADPKSRWFSAAGVQGSQGQTENAVVEAVLGQGAAAQFGKDVGKATIGVGDEFELGARKWVVVGVIKSAGSTFDSEIWAKHAVVSKLFGKETFSSIAIKTASNEAAKRLATDLVTEYKKASLQAMVETDYFEKLSTTNQQFLVAIVIVVVIMAIGGAFGITNTMFAAVSQRIKDIGVLRIVGYARYQVLFSFLLESLMLGLIGGLLGCGIGYLANGWTATSIVSGGGGGGGKSVVLTLTVTPATLAGGLMLALVMGAIGGFFPALAAMRKRPLDTLR